jgi:hypothetical protein
VSAAEIARALGLRRAGREFAGKCPSCGYATGFSLTDRNGVLLYHCHGGAGGSGHRPAWFNPSFNQRDRINRFRRLAIYPRRGQRS